MTKRESEQRFPDDTYYELTLDRVPFPGEAPIKQIRRTGTGLAYAPREGGPTWMAFDGEGMTPPKPDDAWYDTRAQASTMHRHDGSCRQPTEGGVKYVSGGTIVVPEPGWYLCIATGKQVYLHDHGDGKFASHLSGDRRGGCPPPDELAWS